MPIKSIYVKNFRGISEGVNIPIKPITIFIGPNSSGKSTVIHTLAALSQTVRPSNDKRPLILDDEYASVHLGRFIEVIHSRSYQDTISLGLHIDAVHIPDLVPKKPKVNKVDASMCLEFKSTKRTQEVSIESGEVKVGDRTYRIRRRQAEYEIENVQEQKKSVCRLKTGFTFEETDFFIKSGPDAFALFYPFVVAQAQCNEELRRTCYLGPFRQPPQRQYPTRGASPTEVGSQGEFTVTLLANEVSQSQSRTHVAQVASWLEVMRLGKDVQLTRLAGSDLFDVSIKLKDDTSFPISDLGYGLSQVLPVLTQCSFAAPGSTLLFEQPELHLHSLSVRPLATVFIDAMRKRKLTIVAETHSTELVGQFQTELRRGNLKLDELAIYRVSRQEAHTVIAPIQIDPVDFDVYDRWERGLSVPE